MVADLLDHISQHLNIDPKRVYATGFSSGGGLAEWLACSLADRIAAVGPVAGAHFHDSPCQPSRPVPVIAFHGSHDYTVPYWGGYDLFASIPMWAQFWAERNGCNPKPVSGYRSKGVSAQFWGKSDQGADVALYTALNLGHTWPGSK
jgi:polyhydroxybutyrate depolymerase